MPNTKLGRMVSEVANTCEAKILAVFTKNKEEFNGPNTKLGRMVNVVANTCEAKGLVEFTENKEEFNEGRTPCILINFFSHLPTLPQKQLLKDPNIEITIDEELSYGGQMVPSLG